MSEELYKLYRPTDFNEVVGNESTVRSIEAKLESDTLPHLILLSGPSGCGKTTIARILKEKLDCSDYDFKELNCGENGGVDIARDIVKSMKFSPMEGKCKIWLMDECHRLTKAAINAYLKPFEDTPEHVYFIMATSEPESLQSSKEGKAILTRATHWQVHSLDDDEIEGLIKEVAEEEEIDIPDKVLETIVEASAGSSRMALVLLHQINGLTEKQMQEQIEILIQKETNLYELFKALMWPPNWQKASAAIKLLKEEPESIRRGLITMASNQLLGSKTNNWPQAFKIIDCLSAPLYNTGKAGLVAGCYEAIHGE